VGKAAVAVLSSRLARFAPLLDLRRSDLTTEAGRAHERHRRIAMAALASALAKLVSIATALVSVPLTLHYLGTERYGMWVTITTFTSMLTFADLGIGNGLLTAVSRASGRDDVELIRAYVSSALAVLALVACVILAAALAAMATGCVNWPALFNVHGALAKAEAGPAMIVFLVCFALAMPATIIQRLQYGLQMGFVASLWQCAASLLSLAGLLVAIWFRAGLPWLVLCLSGVPLLVACLNSLVFFGWVRPATAPRPQFVSRAYAREVLGAGILFFVLQLAVAVTYTSDNVVIAHMLGAEMVPQYAVPDRLFALTSMMVGFAVTPLWPAFSEAIARGDRAWARRTLLRATTIAGLVGGGFCLLLLLGGKLILHLWVGNAIMPTFALLSGFAVWRTLESLVGPASMYLNGIRAMRFQVVIAVTTATLVIILEVMTIRHVGVAGLPWITSTVYLFSAFIPTVFFLRRSLAIV
jgi:O-antigen/teichoic acid export membrane protein